MQERISVFEEGKLLLFDKPLYWTSFDLVSKVRNILCIATGKKKIKVGHAGTLDPLATGLMIICTGKATRQIANLTGLDKEYLATLTFGKVTPSYDLETPREGDFPYHQITRESITRTLSGFLGEFMQVPPLHSAKQIDGKRAYEFARKGIDKQLDPVSVYFHELELISFEMPEVKIRMRCSKGTYVRSFARDLGNALESGCHLSGLIRSAIGDYNIQNSFTLEKFVDFVEQMKQTGKLYV